jgi:hypothetical protein
MKLKIVECALDAIQVLTLQRRRGCVHSNTPWELTDLVASFIVELGTAWIKTLSMKLPEIAIWKEFAGSLLKGSMSIREAATAGRHFVVLSILDTWRLCPLFRTNERMLKRETQVGK